nr:serine/threonine-protein kinase [Streptomyces sp. SID8014]
MLDGRYRTGPLRDLRSGRETYVKAWDQAAPRPVTLKMLSEDTAATGPGPSPGNERFRSGARTVASATAPRLAPVRDHGTTSVRGLRTWYLVVEGGQGDSLRSVTSTSPPAPRTVLCWATQLCEALAALHLAGQVHADLTPDNVAVTPEGTVVLLAPSLARLAGRPVTSATAGFASPELASGAPNPDVSSDLYSLGCLLYFLITGRAPFRGASADVLRQHREAAPEPTWRHAPLVPQRIDRLVLELLEKDPDRRPADVGEVARRLREIADGPLPPVFGREGEPGRGAGSGEAAGGATRDQEEKSPLAFAPVRRPGGDAPARPPLAMPWRAAAVIAATVAVCTGSAWALLASVGLGRAAAVSGAALALWGLTAMIVWEAGHESAKVWAYLGVLFTAVMGVSLWLLLGRMPGPGWVGAPLAVLAAGGVAIGLCVLYFALAGGMASVLASGDHGHEADVACGIGAATAVVTVAVGAAAKWAQDASWSGAALWATGVYAFLGLGLSACLRLLRPQERR